MFDSCNFGPETRQIKLNMLLDGCKWNILGKE